MEATALDDLKRRIATGEYAIDSASVAGAILSKMAVIRRVRRSLVREAEQPNGELRRRSRATHHPQRGRERFQ
jgi:hypothetical protein